ncbi:MAG: hypothetical protein ACMG6E_04610 [Candidatus Roizmanbacteria bacterium]
MPKDMILAEGYQQTLFKSNSLTHNQLDGGNNAIHNANDNYYSTKNNHSTGNINRNSRTADMKSNQYYYHVDIIIYI